MPTNDANTAVANTTGTTRTGLPQTGFAFEIQGSEALGLGIRTLNVTLDQFTTMFGANDQARLGQALRETLLPAARNSNHGRFDTDRVFESPEVRNAAIGRGIYDFVTCGRLCQSSRKLRDQIFDQGGYGEYLAGVIARSEPVRITLLGLPFKHAGDLVTPDGAEALMFDRMKRVDELVRQVYSPGVHFTILADGGLAVPNFGLRGEQVRAYQQNCRGLAEMIGAPVTIMDLFADHINGNPRFARDGQPGALYRDHFDVSHTRCAALWPRIIAAAASVDPSFDPFPRHRDAAWEATFKTVEKGLGDKLREASPGGLSADDSKAAALLFHSIGTFGNRIQQVGELFPGKYDDVREIGRVVEAMSVAYVSHYLARNALSCVPGICPEFGMYFSLLDLTNGTRPNWVPVDKGGHDATPERGKPVLELVGQIQNPDIQRRVYRGDEIKVSDDGVPYILGKNDVPVPLAPVYVTDMALPPAMRIAPFAFVVASQYDRFVVPNH